MCLSRMFCSKYWNKFFYFLASHVYTNHKIVMEPLRHETSLNEATRSSKGGWWITRGHIISHLSLFPLALMMLLPYFIWVKDRPELHFGLNILYVILKVYFQLHRRYLQRGGNLHNIISLIAFYMVKIDGIFRLRVRRELNFPQFPDRVWRI